VRPPQGPKKVLRAFRRVSLEAGAKTRVSITFRVDELAHYDGKAKREVIDPGRYELLAGASSADIRLKTTFEIAQP
jgi:beta-glucosidase